MWTAGALLVRQDRSHTCKPICTHLPNMAIPQSAIRNASLPFSFSKGGAKAANSVSEARSYALDTAFLCHSHKDNELAEKLQIFLVSLGWNVYIDWKDNTMPDKPNRETAGKIQDRIKQCKWFLLLATENSMASRWCPWELGFSDGVKGKDSIIVIPTSDARGNAYGNEYMELYRRIDYGAADRILKCIDPGNLYSGKSLSSL